METAAHIRKEITASVHHSAIATRLAGGLYLVIIVSGLTAELALRGPALADGLSLQDIPALRLSMLADLAMLGADVALALVFWPLLRRFSEPAALAAMILRLMQATLIAASLILLSGVPAALETAPDTAVLLTRLHANGYDIGLILFGANTLLMALLLCRARAPVLLPPLLAVTGLVYISGGLARLAAPDWVDTIQPAYLICIITETALCLWLLTRARL